MSKYKKDNPDKKAGNKGRKSSSSSSACISESLALQEFFNEGKTIPPFVRKNDPLYEDPSFGRESAELFASGKMTGSDRQTENISAKEHPHAGHRARLRTRYLQAGTGGMTDFDLLELLLTYAVPRRDVKEPSRILLKKFKTLGGIVDADHKDLCSVAGISDNSALLFKIIRDLCVRYLQEKTIGKNVLDSPQAVEDYARMKLGGYAEEVMMIIYVNVQNCVMDSQIVSKGTVDSAVVYPREIAAEALAKKASGVILVHNHPSGNVMASEEDIEFTGRVRRSLAALDILLLDHLIVSRTAACSVFDQGHIR